MKSSESDRYANWRPPRPDPKESPRKARLNPARRNPCRCRTERAETRNDSAAAC